MSWLRIYGLNLFKSVALLLAILGAITAPIGLAFLSCVDVDERWIVNHSLWDTDYCSGWVGLFLVITTAEFLYLGVLTEFQVIPRPVGFLLIGMMGAIACAYLIGIMTI